ncbi:MAG: hypothetical protein E7376_01800 [Clostridiales bacterium]|nr:hypothetical protein [Clostridiales bacterium]
MKLKRFAALGATCLLLTGALTGCSKELEEAQDNLNKAGLAAINRSQIVKIETSDEINDYVFSGADFLLEGQNYTIDVNGFTESQNGQKAYACLKYDVPASEFAQIDAKDSVEVLNAIAKVVNEYEMKSFEYAPMKSLTEFNKTIGKTFESPLDGYNYSSNLTYSVKSITFNEQEGYVSFKTNQNVDYVKRVTRTTLVYNGKTMVPIVQTQYYHEKFNQEHEIFIKASPEEMQAMKEDKSLIFDKFIRVVKEEQKSEYVVKAGNIQNQKAFDDAPEYDMSR